MELAIQHVVKVNDICIDKNITDNFINNYKNVFINDIHLHCFEDWIKLPNTMKMIDETITDIPIIFPSLTKISMEANITKNINVDKINITIDITFQLIDLGILLGYITYTVPYYI